MSSAGVQAHFTNATAPAPGARICISGFTRAGFEEASRLVTLQGYRPTSFTAGADAILVPTEAAAEALTDTQRGGRHILSLAQLRGLMSEAACRSALEVGEDWVRVLDVTLPRHPPGGRHVPSLDRFAHLCLDATFLKAARAAAIAARDGLSCAFEGETATAKTTSVLWLAALCRQGVVRLNLNGQSDTGELVGRYVPDSGEDEKIQNGDRDARNDDRDSLSFDISEEPGDETMARRASSQRVGGMGWRFWEGYVPQAMRHGWWVVLDELNLAEPQVLERLNPALELPPTLVLSEHTGAVFGPGGDVAVASDFRLFATMNPAEYSGRSVLSPALRDRFGVWNFVQAPGEGELKSLLRFLVYGQQPEFSWGHMLWKAPDNPPVHPALAQVEGIDTLLDRVAAFHMAVASASGAQGNSADLGRTRRERYVFTRRTLLGAMRLFDRGVVRGVAPHEALRQALELSYVERVAPGGDRQAVEAALRATELPL